MNETVRALFPKGLRVDTEAQRSLVAHLGEPKEGTLFAAIYGAAGLRYQGDQKKDSVQIVAASDTPFLRKKGTFDLVGVDAAQVTVWTGASGTKFCRVQVGGSEIAENPNPTEPARLVFHYANTPAGERQLVIKTPATPQANTAIVYETNERTMIQIERPYGIVDKRELRFNPTPVDPELRYPIDTDLVVDGVMRSIREPEFMHIDIRRVPTDITAFCTIPIQLPIK